MNEQNKDTTAEIKALQEQIEKIEVEFAETSEQVEKQYCRAEIKKIRRKIKKILEQNE